MHSLAILAFSPAPRIESTLRTARTRGAAKMRGTAVFTACCDYSEINCEHRSLVRSLLSLSIAPRVHAITLPSHPQGLWRADLRRKRGRPHVIFLKRRCGWGSVCVRARMCFSVWFAFVSSFLVPFQVRARTNVRLLGRRARRLWLRRTPASRRSTAAPRRWPSSAART